MPTEPATDFINDLRARDLFHQTTDEEGLRKHLAAGPRRGYIGYDPTSDSLTIGNMVTMMMLARLQRAGHTPVVLSGGGTGLIGDPSGKSSERTLMSEETVRANVESQKRIFSRVIDCAPGRFEPIFVNNIDWLGKLGFLEALRDIGKHFSVNMMIQKDSVRARLTERDQGISYTEFSYMILQSYDFAHLHKTLGVTLQMGGSDQWGNIVGGIDLVRRTAGDAPAFGLTAPLVTKADGTKFGKSESGAIWMTADRTSPYALYQFWLNADDAEIPRFLRTFTFLPDAEVAGLLAQHQANPGAREAHRVLAREVTSLLHGVSEMQQAEAAAKALFSGEIAALPEKTLAEVFAGVPSSTQPRASLSEPGVVLADLLVTTQLAASKREAREFLQSGSVSVNGRKVGPDDRVTTADLLHGHTIALRRGKKQWHITRWA